VDLAHVDLHEGALGAHTGRADLEISSDFAGNDGTSRIAGEQSGAGRSVRVNIGTIDDTLGNESIGMLKLDVEGFEAHVLRGAAGALAHRRIRHIVFEEHDIANSAVIELLRRAGFRMFSLGWALRGPRVQPVEQGILASPYEAPSFVATLDPDDVLTRFRPSGWRVLSRRLSARRASSASTRHNI
jgi:hypothetical protein